MRILINPFEEAEKLTQERGEWVVAVIETRLFWPKSKQTIFFNEMCFILMPFEQNDQQRPPTLPAIALRADFYKLSISDARKEILQLASALSWREGDKIEVVSWSGGNVPRSMGIMQNSAVSEFLDENHLPLPTDENARAALAFYREGVSLDNPFYSFLSFYKAFSVAIKATERKAWMNENETSLDSYKIHDRLNELRADGHNIGTYLFEECRNAIAHADREPFVNPDNTDDYFRLKKDIPIIQNYAELAIEKTFGIKRFSTTYREHCYELDGFRKLLPLSLIESFKQQKPILEPVEINVPEQILVLARKSHETYPLDFVKFHEGGISKDGILLRFSSSFAVSCLDVFLDFKNERLIFDPIRDLKELKDDTKKVFVQESLAILKFVRCILSNGHIELWDTDTKQLLSKSESYIPLNCSVNTDFFRNEQARLEGLLD